MDEPADLLVFKSFTLVIELFPICSILGNSDVVVTRVMGIILLNVSNKHFRLFGATYLPKPIGFRL